MEDIIVQASVDLGSRDSARILSASQAVEALIAKICLNNSETLRKGRSNSRPAELEAFLANQDKFGYNIVGIVSCHLHHALTSSMISPEAVVSMLHMLRGLCLVHRPSRAVFNDTRLMTILIQGVKHEDPRIQSSIVNLLMGVMVRQVDNIRLFEQLNGLKVVCDTFKRSATAKEVKLSILQFLFLYLIPETRRTPSGSRKTTQDKQLLLGKYLSNVDGLVRELETLQPFGQSHIEW